MEWRSITLNLGQFQQHSWSRIHGIWPWTLMIRWWTSVDRWELDFGGLTTIYFVRIWRRIDCCELPRNVKILVVEKIAGRRTSKWEYYTTNADRDSMVNTFLELWPAAMGTAFRIEPQWPYFLLSLSEVRVFGWRQGCPEEITCRPLQVTIQLSWLSQPTCVLSAGLVQPYH